MRQAGRYLPEFREIRAKNPDFIKLCLNENLSSEITLQPLKRFDLDAAIIFSDILVIPDALGTNVRFEENIGPMIDGLNEPKDVAKLHFNQSLLDPVYEAIELTKKQLSSHVSLIGFAGAAWTLAAYMLQSKSAENFQKAKQWAYANKREFDELLAIIENAVVTHLVSQVRAGCDAIQIFDSWAGLLSVTDIQRWSVESLTRIIRDFKHECPTTPVIIFPRGAGTNYGLYDTQYTGASAIGVDQFTSLAWASEHLQAVLQGNIDPLLLALDKDAMLTQARENIALMKGKPFIFNLGHGVIPQTPPEHVELLVNLVKESDCG